MRYIGIDNITPKRVRGRDWSRSLSSDINMPERKPVEANTAAREKVKTKNVRLVYPRRRICSAIKAKEGQAKTYRSPYKWLRLNNLVHKVL